MRPVVPNRETLLQLIHKQGHISHTAQQIRPKVSPRIATKTQTRSKEIDLIGRIDTAHPPDDLFIRKLLNLASVGCAYQYVKVIAHYAVGQHLDTAKCRHLPNLLTKYLLLSPPSRKKSPPTIFVMQW
jgi:hypothetical protein